MPDPSDPTPVRVAKRGGKFVVVDKNGKKLAGQEALGDSVKASGVAARINSTWERAKSDRRSKGAPEITEGYLPGRFNQASQNVRTPNRSKGTGLSSMAFVPGSGVPMSKVQYFDPVKHPRRKGEFRSTVGHLLAASKGHLLHESRVDAVLKQMTESAFLHALPFDKSKHPRGRAGKWSFKPGQVVRLKGDGPVHGSILKQVGKNHFSVQVSDTAGPSTYHGSMLQALPTNESGRLRSSLAQVVMNGRANQPTLPGGGREVAVSTREKKLNAALGQGHGAVHAVGTRRTPIWSAYHPKHGKIGDWVNSTGAVQALHSRDIDTVHVVHKNGSVEVHHKRRR